MSIDLNEPSSKPQTLEEAQKVIDQLWLALGKLNAQVQALQEKRRSNSSNSSKAPSSDIGRSKKVLVGNKKSGKKQGGQPGREGKGRELSDSAEVIIEVCAPYKRCECGAAVHPTKHVQQASVVHCDETGHKERYARHWMWVEIAGLVSVFLARAGRSATQAKELLGALAAGLHQNSRAQWCGWANRVATGRAHPADVSLLAPTPKRSTQASPV